MKSPCSPRLFVAGFSFLCFVAAAEAAPQKTVFRQDWNDYAGVDEKRLLKNSQTSGAATLFVDGGHGGTPVVYGNDGLVISYLKFADIFGSGAGQIPAGAHILKARLTLTTSIGTDHQSGSWFAPAALTEALPEPLDGVSILESFAQTPGTYRGPDFPDGHILRLDSSFHSTDEPVLRLDQGESSSSDVTETVRHWAEDPERNHGFIIWPLPTGTDGWSYMTSFGGGENGEGRPTLEIDWLPPAEATAQGAATKVFRQGLNDYEGTVSAFLPDTVTPVNATNFATLAARSPLNGATRSAITYIDGVNEAADSPDDQILIQFKDIFGTGEHQIEIKPQLKIARAALRITSGGTGTVDPYATPAVAPNNVRSGSVTYVHRMLVPWYEEDEGGSVFFLTFPEYTGGLGPKEADGEISPSLGFYTGTSNDQTSSVDVTEAVQAWAAGAPNHGFNLQMEGADGWGIFMPGVGDETARPELVVTYYYENDTDGDGLPNEWEAANGTNPNVPDANGDADGDGLLNHEEYALGTKGNAPDTDGDGLSDKVETKKGVWTSASDTGTNPLHPDTDGDGLSDGVENPDLPYVNAAQPGTNPLMADTDGDGFTDQTEVLLNTDPKVAAKAPSFTYDVLLSENFDGVSVHSVYSFLSATNGEFYPDVLDSETVGYGQAAKFTDANDTSTATSSSLAWDHVASDAPAWRLSFDYFMSPDNGAEEVADGIGFGFYRTATYFEEGPVNPATTPRQWEDPRAWGGHVEAVAFGFDIYSGAVEGNTIRMAGPVDTTAGITNVTSPFQLNNGKFNRVVVTAVTSGADTSFSLEITEDASGAAPVTHRLINQALARGFDIRSEKIRLIFGGRTGTRHVTSFVDNVVFEKGALATTPVEPLPPFAITAVIRDGDSVDLTWESSAGATYRVERSTSLATGEWTIIAPSVAGAAGTTTYSDPLATPPASHLFYRVTRLAQP